MNRYITWQELGLLDPFEYETLDRFQKDIKQFVQTRKEEIRTEAKKFNENDFRDQFDYTMYQDYLGDEDSIAEEIGELADQLIIVALYRKVELTTKRLLKYADPALYGKKLSYIEEVKKQLKKKGTSYDKIKASQAIDELRCLNNAIKHEGIVNEKLSGEELSDLGKAYERLSKDVPVYLKDLYSKLIGDSQY